MMPDAPWIRDAETNGVGSDLPDEVYCPVCGKEAERFYLSPDGDVIACNCCVKVMDAIDWLDNQEGR